MQIPKVNTKQRELRSSKVTTMSKIRNMDVEERETETEEAEEPRQALVDETAQRFLSPEEEKEIIRKVQYGDVAAFEDLVNAYKQKAYYVALGFVGNHEDALDLSQDAFVKAFKAIKTFDLNSPFFPWFYKIIKNHCLNYIKKNQRVRNDSLEEMEEESPQARLSRDHHHEALP
jgi:DNA-directed RNA polymerase sigma subunit (sigma70/sigma32)